MKRIITIVFLLSITCLGYAQSGFSYQAVLRDADGALRTNESLVVLAKIKQGNTVKFEDNYLVTTNEFGVFSLIVGDGNESFNPEMFLDNESANFEKTYLEISEMNGDVLSTTRLLGVPMAEIARVAITALNIDFPPGAIVPFAGPAESIPDGWLLCDGTEYNESDYPNLYHAIGPAWGRSAAGKFNVPDLRGTFLRGVAHDSAIDPDRSSRTAKPGGNPGNKVGSYQGDAFQSHKHPLRASNEANANFGTRDKWENNAGPIGDQTTMIDLPVTNNSNPIGLKGGNETRPKNAYVNYMIKY